MLELLFNIKSPPSQSHFIIEPSSSPQMKREKALAHFLLLWLLLAAFQHHNITIPKVQATESGKTLLYPSNGLHNMFPELFYTYSVRSICLSIFNTQCFQSDQQLRNFKSLNRMEHEVTVLDTSTLNS
ncbi:hypothetical protein RHMOL_Rhmol01G0307800 [Rhododendron molle]|uniref:Uncharacterized protein n=1 Tax=Rhododendron molle TaxID=49168 RepID=A0ACC0QA31_RHOML|nr:hypothetical protein RHMOL_Rhmol01G0307800 [Rhododendron molle]